MPEQRRGERQAAIFEQDPLLLKKRSQREYGQELLKNLLTGRRIAGVPDDIDLHRGATARAATTVPPAPADDILDAYKQHRDERRPLALADKDVDHLKGVTMVADGGKTERRLRPQATGGKSRKRRARRKIATNEEATKALETKQSTLDKRLRIAAVGFRVKVSRLRDQGYLGEDLGVLGKAGRDRLPGLPAGLADELRRTTPLGDTSDWANTICGHIEKAVSNGSHIVVLPEFAFPPALDPQSFVNRIRRTFEESASPTERLVFAGSRHDGFHNRGMVLHWKDGKFQREQAEASPDRFPEPDWHYKFASARGLGENVLGPHLRKPPSYRFKARDDIRTSVGIAICYDSFDPSTFLSLVLDSTVRASIYQYRIILVPSFNPSDYFVELLRDLSFLAQCIVLYVNGLHGDAKMYIAGFAMSDILEKTGGQLLTQLEGERDRIDRIRNTKNEAVEEVWQEQHLIPGRKDDELRKNLDRKIGSLDRLRTALQELQTDGGLDHLITVEQCDACTKQKHDRSGYHCATDILYYNIDHRLITALFIFRRDYFELDESFLPQPYHVAEIQGIWEAYRRDATRRRARRRSTQAPESTQAAD